MRILIWSRFIDNLKIKSRQKLELARLSTTQKFYNYKVFEVFIIRKNDNKLFNIFEFQTLKLEDLNNNQKLLIVDFIVIFYETYLSREISNGLKSSDVIVLRHYSYDDIIKDINLYTYLSLITLRILLNIIVTLNR